MIGDFTLQQLEDGCRMGMLDSWGTTVYRPDYKEVFEKQKDILEYVIVNRHQFNSINARYLHFKRSEIKTEKDSIPYSTRLGNICGEDVFIIQQLDYDNMSAKIVGMPNEIAIIKSHIRDNVTFEGMTDDEFYEAHRRDLGYYKNIPHLHGFVEGAFNIEPERTDEYGLHITSIDDYDNYQYTIYGISQEEYYKTVAIETKRKKNEDRVVKLEEKYDKWEKDIQEHANRIITILINNKEFVYEIGKYGHNDGYTLSNKNIMTDLCKKHNVSYKGGWAVWKFLNLKKLKHYIEDEEYLEYDDTLPYLFRSNHKSITVGEM